MSLCPHTHHLSSPERQVCLGVHCEDCSYSGAEGTVLRLGGVGGGALLLLEGSHSLAGQCRGHFF